MKQILDNYVKNYKKTRLEEIIQREETNKSNEDEKYDEEDYLEDKEKLDREIEDLTQFLNAFASKVIIFDPLDR